MKIFFDMDGVLAKWNPVPFDTVCTPGYFESLQPDNKMIFLFTRLLLTEEFGSSVGIMSAVISDEAAEEKRKWLKRYIPSLSENQIHFVRYGEDKGKGLNFGEEKMFLIDDFSSNLRAWRGVGIKYYNGINGTKGTWQGYSISSRTDMETTYRQLMEILESENRKEAA